MSHLIFKILNNGTVQPSPVLDSGPLTSQAVDLSIIEVIQSRLENCSHLILFQGCEQNTSNGLTTSVHLKS